MADSKKHTPDALKAAPAVAGKADLPECFEEWWAGRDSKGEKTLDYNQRKQLAWDAFYAAALSAQVQDVAGWQLIDTAPKDGTPILAWCDHEADPYHDEEGDRLTDYGCWAEALSRVQDGLAVVQWGGEDTDYDEWSGKTLHWPNWWFRVGSDFQEVGNPTHWMPLPAAPSRP